MRDQAIFATLWVILSAIGEVIVNRSLGYLPAVAAAEGQISDEAFVFLLRIIVPVFVFVGLVLAYSAIRFRAKPGSMEPSPVQLRNHRPFAWSWFALSAALNVLFIINPGITGLEKIWASEAQKPGLVVEVTAQQWGWSYSYPQQGIMAVKTLVLPVGKTVEFKLVSKDVIHSFWIPAFRIKKDVIPGETRTLYLTPDRIISTASDPLARVQCAQICGVGHAEMRSAVQVVSQADFDAWVKTQKMNAMKMGS